MSENLTVAAAKPAGKGLTIAIVVSAIVTIAGIALWGVQIAGGLIQTGSRDMAPWGLYMMCVMFRQDCENIHVGRNRACYFGCRFCHH